MNGREYLVRIEAEAHELRRWSDTTTSTDPVLLLNMTAKSASEVRRLARAAIEAWDSEPEPWDPGLLPDEKYHAHAEVSTDSAGTDVELGGTLPAEGPVGVHPPDPALDASSGTGVGGVRPLSDDDAGTDDCGFSWGGATHLHRCSSHRGHPPPHICGVTASGIFKCDDTWHFPGNPNGSADDLRIALEEIGRRAHAGPPDPPGPGQNYWYNLLIELGGVARAALAADSGSEVQP